jgi:hypothetical protein
MSLRTFPRLAAAAPSAEAAFLAFIDALSAKTAFYSGIPSPDLLDAYCARPFTERLVVSNPECLPGLDVADDNIALPPGADEELRGRRWAFVGRPEWRPKICFVWPNHYEGWRFRLCDGEVQYWERPCSLELQDCLSSVAFVSPQAPEAFGSDPSRFILHKTAWGTIGVRVDFSEPRTPQEAFAAMRREFSFPEEGAGWGEGIQWVEAI